MQSKPVGWFEIYTQDLKRAQAFYETVFAFKLENSTAQSLHLRCWPFPARWTTATVVRARW